MRNNDRLESVIDKHTQYWRASEEYAHALEELNGMNGLDDEDIQRLRVMKTKLVADRCQIEFDLNRLVEKNQ